MVDATETPMAERLLAFLEQFENKPTEWGVDDCSAICARWAVENGFPVELPRYSSEREARRIIASAGGLVEVWNGIALDAGLPEREGYPEIGDVALIDTRLFGPIGVIVAAGGLCCRRIENGGMWMAPLSYLKVWAIS